MDDDNLVMFISATGATDAEARQFLTITNNDLNLAVEMYFETGGSQKYVSPSDFAEQYKPPVPEVREPIPQKRETLVDHDQMHLHARPKRVEVPKSVFENAETAPNDKDGAKKSKLAELFRAPVEIMEMGTFEDAQDKAMREKKWLMINVIDPSVFQSQAQNRDLWKDSGVQEMVKASTVFMQLGSNTQEGKEYLRLYPNYVYPHISMIDPRTGERVASWNDVFNPTTFMMKLGDFLDSWSLESNKRPKNESTPKGKDPLALTEEEQLEMALAASLDPTRPEIKEPEVDMNDIDDEEDEDNLAESLANPFKKLKPVLYQEPEASAPGATRVQIRLKDGTRIVKRFLKTDKVSVIYEHLKATIPDLNPSGVEFELNLHSGKTSDKLEQTLEEAGVANAALNLSY